MPESLQLSSSCIIWCPQVFGYRRRHDHHHRQETGWLDLNSIEYDHSSNNVEHSGLISERCLSTFFSYTKYPFKSF
jgi:hypothetical protein